MEVTGEVIEELVCSLEGGLGKDDPFGFPDGFGEVDMGKSFAGHAHEDGPEEYGKGLFGNQKIVPCREPAFAVIGQTSTRDEAMDMGMIGHGSGPGMQNSQDPDLATDVFRIGSQFDER